MIFSGSVVDDNSRVLKSFWDTNFSIRYNKMS